MKKFSVILAIIFSITYCKEENIVLTKDNITSIGLLGDKPSRSFYLPGGGISFEADVDDFGEILYIDPKFQEKSISIQSCLFKTRMTTMIRAYEKEKINGLMMITSIDKSFVLFRINGKYIMQELLITHPYRGRIELKISGCYEFGSSKMIDYSYVDLLKKNGKAENAETYFKLIVKGKVKK